MGLEACNCLRFAHMTSQRMKNKNPNVKLFLNFGSEGRVKNKRLNIEGM